MSIHTWRFASAETQPNQVAPAPAAIPQTILLAEDDPAVRGLLLRLLRRHGYMVCEATDGAHALSLAQNQLAPFDLLLTDVMMPHLNGVELAHQLRARGSVKTVLFITGFADELLDATPSEQILHKPFAPATLLAYIEQILGRAS